METNKTFFKWFYIAIIVILSSIMNYYSKNSPIILAIANIILMGVASWKIADYYNRFGK